ncbi:MAG: hypothetical protein ABFD46_10555 [Armatimonadota bacterium]
MADYDRLQPLVWIIFAVIEALFCRLWQYVLISFISTDKIDQYLSSGSSKYRMYICNYALFMPPAIVVGIAMGHILGLHLLSAIPVSIASYLLMLIIGWQRFPKPRKVLGYFGGAQSEAEDLSATWIDYVKVYYYSFLHIVVPLALGTLIGLIIV